MTFMAVGVANSVWNFSSCKNGSSVKFVTTFDFFIHRALSAGGYYRIHYFILVYPAIALVLGLLVYNLAKIHQYIKASAYFCLCVIIILFLTCNRDSLFQFLIP